MKTTIISPRRDRATFKYIEKRCANPTASMSVSSQGQGGTFHVKIPHRHRRIVDEGLFPMGSQAC